MNKIIAVITISLFLVGCASAPVKIGKDTYMMTNSGAWSWSSGSKLKAELYQDAQKFCAEKGLQMASVDSKARHGSFTQFAQSEITFRCLPENDPEYKRPEFKQPDRLDLNIDR